MGDGPAGLSHQPAASRSTSLDLPRPTILPLRGPYGTNPRTNEAPSRSDFAPVRRSDGGSGCPGLELLAAQGVDDAERGAGEGDEDFGDGGERAELEAECCPEGGGGEADQEREGGRRHAHGEEPGRAQERGQAEVERGQPA